MKLECCKTGRCLACSKTPEGANKRSAYRKLLWQQNRELNCLKLKERYQRNKDSYRLSKANHYEQHKERIKAASRAYYALHVEACKLRFKKYQASSREKRRQYRANRSELDRLVRQQYLRRNPRKSAIDQSFRRAVKKQAIPKWLSKAHKEEIRKIYRQRPSGFHVDHIVPLSSKLVCGLHVPWNLQYLPAVENLRKSNRLAE